MDAKTQDSILKWFVDNGANSTLSDTQAKSLFDADMDSIGEMEQRINQVWPKTFVGSKMSLTVMRNLDRIADFLSKGGGGLMAIEDSANIRYKGSTTFNVNNSGNIGKIGNQSSFILPKHLSKNVEQRDDPIHAAKKSQLGISTGSVKNWINNNWVVTIVGGIIVLVLGYFLIGWLKSRGY